jgi:hypothetical protein
MQTSEPESYIDVTGCLFPYREAARHLWNILFAGSSLANFDGVEAFGDIAGRLFDAVVAPLAAAQAGLADDGGLRESLRVVPSTPDGVPIMIENPREGTHNQYWDHPITHVRPDEAELRFLDYYDWDELGMRDYQYYLVEIVSFVNHPELERRHALVEVQHALVKARRRPAES